MSDDVHTRAGGLRLAVVATAACQARGLDQTLDCGHRALDILARVTSARAGTRRFDSNHRVPLSRAQDGPDPRDPRTSEGRGRHDPHRRGGGSMPSARE